MVLNINAAFPCRCSEHLGERGATRLVYRLGG
jgi:hypothetical protein